MQAIARALWAGLLLWSLPVAGADTPTVLKPALPQEPLHYDSAEGAALTVNLRTHGLAYPPSLIFLPDESAPAAQKDNGVIHHIVGGKLRDMLIQDVSEVVPSQYSDLLNMALHPDFANQPCLSPSYNKPLSATQIATTYAPGSLDGHNLVDTRDFYAADSSATSDSRFLFGTDGLHALTNAADGAVLHIEPSIHGSAPSSEFSART